MNLLNANCYVLTHFIWKKLEVNIEIIVVIDHMAMVHMDHNKLQKKENNALYSINFSLDQGENYN